MLNFIISTLAFSIAAYTLNRIFNTKTTSPRSHTFAIMTTATLISIGAGWAVDKFDGDAELNKHNPSMIEVFQSGDPMKIMKMLSGFN